MDVYLRVRLTAQLTLALLVRDISKYTKDGTVLGKHTLRSLVVGIFTNTWFIVLTFYNSNAHAC